MNKMFSILLVLALGLTAEAANAAADNQPPVADAGLPLYTDGNDVVLDGTKSFDPDNTGILRYYWQQVSGPAVVITVSDTATPTVSGFVQTDSPQLCEFQLVVNDGRIDSLPDTAKVWILSIPNATKMILENEDTFDSNKHTVIHFGGGNCVIGAGSWFDKDWEEKANIISFPHYRPDETGDTQTYYKCGDLIIKYLSTVAPNYNLPIQITGHSTGGQPTMDAGLRLNLLFQDARYAVNRITFLDARCRDYSQDIAAFLSSPVDSEQCWIDTYEAGPIFYPGILNAQVGQAHNIPPQWYRDSLTNPIKNRFNGGIVAGAYWSVVGPGKNLQLAHNPDSMIYMFLWNGTDTVGDMVFFDENYSTARLPEPVTLSSHADVGFPDGTFLTCQESENAIGYQLLFGSDPHRVMDYEIISDTPTPPNEVITTLPFEQTFWTVRVYDQYGSTIYADPICITNFNLSFPVENLTTGKKYSYIQFAIDEAEAGDEIVLKKGIYHESIELEGKVLTVRSTDPNDPAVAAETIINGGHRRSAITLSDSKDKGCLIDGLTIIGETRAISCRDASLTIRNCTIESNSPVAIEFWYGYELTIINCTIPGQVKSVKEPKLIAHWRLDETEGNIAEDSAGQNDGVVNGDPLWQPEGGMVFGALQFDGTNDYVSTGYVLNPMYNIFSVFAWVKGGAPGQTIISQVNCPDWLLADSSGNLKTGLRASGRFDLPLTSQTVIIDGNWHRVGLTWDDSYRILYVDDIEVARDTDEQSRLLGSEDGLYIGAGKSRASGSFWSGLIDDVRIYNRAVTP